MTPMTKEQAVQDLEDAVHAAVEAGLTKREITESVEYALRDYEELDES